MLLLLLLQVVSARMFAVFDCHTYIIERSSKSRTDHSTQLTRQFLYSV